MKVKLQNSYIGASKVRAFITTLLLFSIISGFSQTNLFINGDFETGTINWTAWGAHISVSSDAHSGSYSALVSNRKNPYDALVRDITSLIVNGKTYKLSEWVKILEPSKNYEAMIVLTVDGLNTYKSLSLTANPVIGSYAYYKDSTQLSWSGNLTSAHLYFQIQKTDSVYSDYLVDDVTMEGPSADTSSEVVWKGLKDIRSTILIGGPVTEGSVNYFTNATAKAQVLSDCNAVTVQCYPSWGLWDETLHNVYHLEDFGFEVEEMKRQKMDVTAHMLLGWDQYFPDWYKNNDFTADTIETIMKSWLEAIIKYNGNDTLVDIWNVVNEAISWNGKGGYWPESNPDHLNACKLQKIGYEPDSSGLTGINYVNAQHPVYIRRAFEYARKLTNKKLELRESNFEFPTDQKYNAFYQLAVHLKNVHAPVDAIAFQTHLDLENIYDWEGYTNNIKRYKRLGYNVNVPEVDIGDVDESWSDDKANLQKMMYYRLVVSAIKGGASELQTWGFNDEYSWRSGQHPLPYAKYFVPKPAYYGIKEALADMSQILYWEMDTTESNIMPDVMKYDNYGTLNNFNTPAIVNGFKSKAIRFDGIDDFISTGILSDSISGDLTFSCYIKTSTTKPGIIADIALDVTSGLKLGINSSGKLYLNDAEAGLGEDLVSTNNINDGTWHFVAVQRDSDTYRLYLDTANSIASGNGSIQTLVKLVVGAKSDGSEAFGGIIDEVKLYNTAVEEASFTRSMVPYCPLKLAASQNDKIIKLKWIGQSDDEDGFVIEREAKDSVWAEHAFVGPTTLALTDTIELYNTSYTYRIRAFNKFGNSDPSNSISVISYKDTLTSINENSNISECFNSFIYPNPVNSSFTLVSPENSSARIFDIRGRLMIEKYNLSGKELFDFSPFSPGMYILETFTGEKTDVVKIIKQ